MDDLKEPLYMKWWAWVAIFLVTAIIVNYTSENHSPTDVSPEVADEISEDIGEEAISAIAMITYSFEEMLAINEGNNFDYDTPVTFEVGIHLPAGEYFALTTKDSLGYVLLTRSRKLMRDEIIWQKHFENHTIIYIRYGEYLTTKNTTLIPIEDAIIPNFVDGVLKAGTYRIGKDIPPGVYTLFPNHNKVGFFSTAATSQQLEAHTIQQRNFREPITIALNIGDYFTMIRAEIRK